jgi:hypothetical protein
LYICMVVARYTQTQTGTCIRWEMAVGCWCLPPAPQRKAFPLHPYCSPTRTRLVGKTELVRQQGPSVQLDRLADVEKNNPAEHRHTGRPPVTLVGSTSRDCKRLWSPDPAPVYSHGSVAHYTGTACACPQQPEEAPTPSPKRRRLL